MELQSKQIINKILSYDFKVSFFNNTTVTVILDDTGDIIFYDGKQEEGEGAFYHYKDDGSPKETLKTTNTIKDALKQAVMLKIERIKRMEVK